MSAHVTSPGPWAIILAGGDGVRTQELARILTGEPRPKQFCNFFGGRSLLAHTRDRIAPLFDPQTTLFALTRAHRAFFDPELQDVKDDLRLVQPSNRGTAAAIALSISTIARRDRDAVVAIFPSDHHYIDPKAFQTTLTSSLDLVREYPHSLLLLGAEPSYPETEYGWIEPGRTLTFDEPVQVQKVTRFWEKPNRDQSESLMRQSCLWNTFVVVGYAWAFLELFHATMPDLLPAIDRARRLKRMDALYAKLPSADFSRAVLAPMASRLLVARGPDAGWTDLGNPRRVTEAIEREGFTTAWASSLRAQMTAGAAAW